MLAYKRSKSSDYVSVGIGFALIEGALWTHGYAQGVFGALALLWIVGTTILERPATAQLGIRWQRWRIGMAPTVGIAAVVSGLGIVVAYFLGTLHAPPRPSPFPLGTALYLLWALVQQFMLQCFFYVRFERAMKGQSEAVIASATLFAAAHAPSPILCFATFWGGLFFCNSFRQHRNIYPIAMAHGILAYGVSAAVPLRLLREMRVGAAYIHFH